MATRGTTRPALPRPSRRLWIGLGVVVLVLVVLAVVVALEASRAKSSLEQAADQAKTLQQQITTGESKQAEATLTSLRTSTERARTNTDGPLWSVLSHLPWAGDSVSAVRTASSSLDDIAQRGLPPLVKVSSSLDADLFKPKDGEFDVATFAKLAPAVTNASDVLTRNARDIEDIDQADLISAVQGPIAELQDKIGTAETAASTASRALRLAPDMLGGDGTRRYLLIFQNNAEIRSSGGLPGAFAILTAKNGRIAIDRQGAGTDIEQYDEPVVKLSKDELAIFGDLLGRDFRDTNFTPDFPRTAAIARKMVTKAYDTDIDGVFSLDPVTLGYLLEGTGPIDAGGDTTLTGANAVDVLLNNSYARFSDPRAQDAFFAQAARRVFDAVVDGKGDSRAVLEGLAKGVDERRVLMWAKDKKEQAQIAGTEIAGELKTSADQPQVGVYVNDSTASKMQYYLDFSTDVKATACSDTGVQTMQMTSTFTSTAPADASLLPGYITGAGENGPRGTQVLTVRFFGPQGGKFTSVAVNGKRTLLSPATFEGRPVQRAVLRLKPGAKATVTTTVVSGKDQRGTVELSSTPGLRSSQNGVMVPSACG